MPVAETYRNFADRITDAMWMNRATALVTQAHNENKTVYCVMRQHAFDRGKDLVSLHSHKAAAEVAMQVDKALYKYSGQCDYSVEEWEIDGERIDEQRN